MNRVRFSNSTIDFINQSINVLIHNKQIIFSKKLFITYLSGNKINNYSSTASIKLNIILHISYS